MESTTEYSSLTWLRRFAKLTVASTLFLIFAGSLVTSTGSGLAVPDWPLSYGMVFPPMVGGVFYEHGHRMIATTVGFFMLILTVWLWKKDDRPWVRRLGFVALGAVITQGIFGGITVLYFLPTAVSVTHGVLAQTFFILTIVIAYSLSRERYDRLNENDQGRPELRTYVLIAGGTIYLQLILGALMRHTGSGLAFPDFPLTAGYVIPLFNQSMLDTINEWRFERGFTDITLGQTIIHFIHRVGALVVTAAVGVLSFSIYKHKEFQGKIFWTTVLIDGLLLMQLTLGAFTIWTEKAPYVASFHVLTGATMLGVIALLALRILPLTIASRDMSSETV